MTLTHIHICIYIYVYTCTYTSTYSFFHRPKVGDPKGVKEKEKGEREKEGTRERNKKEKGKNNTKRERRGKGKRGKKQIQGPTRELASLAPPRRGGQLCSATKNLKYPLLRLRWGYLNDFLLRAGSRRGGAKIQKIFNFVPSLRQP